MGDRRALVIGSQCKQLGTLSFLPKVAEELYDVLTDPAKGGCTAATPHGLLLDPTVDQARTAIEGAFRLASEAEATLFLVFIGHGEHVGNDFYLLPFNASLPPRSHTAIHLVQLIKELHSLHSDLDGLVVLLDTCYSGVAAAAAADKWGSELEGTLRFEVLTAAADRPATGDCFSKNLADLMKQGIPTVSAEFLRCEHVCKILKQLCPNQSPQHPTWNADEGLYLARNTAKIVAHEPWVRTSAQTEIERLTSWYQPTPQLTQIVDASRANRCVAVIGAAGTGKSALSAALSKPSVTEQLVPKDFVQAVMFLAETTSSGELAQELAKQLDRSLPTVFASAKEEFQKNTIIDERNKLDPLEREIVGPLKWLTSNQTVRILLDGLDRLSAGASATIPSMLRTLMGPEFPMIRLIVMSRPDTPVPAGSHRLDVERADERYILQYLQRRTVPEAFHSGIVQRADGNWLIARLLADFVIDPRPSAQIEELPDGLVAIYDEVLLRVGAGDKERWRSVIRPVLGTLAAAGNGAILPLALLCHASAKMGRPEKVGRIRDLLVDLRGYVVRRNAGTDREHVGLFHQTFAEYLLSPQSGQFGLDPKEPHEALARAIEELAPMAKHDEESPLHRYAAIREPEHLWIIGEYESAINVLETRESRFPAENLKRWQAWTSRVTKTLGNDHSLTLRTRHNLAHWIERNRNAGQN